MSSFKITIVGDEPKRNRVPSFKEAELMQKIEIAKRIEYHQKQLQELYKLAMAAGVQYKPII